MTELILAAILAMIFGVIGMVLAMVLGRQVNRLADRLAHHDEELEKISRELAIARVPPADGGPSPTERIRERWLGLAPPAPWQVTAPPIDESAPTSATLPKLEPGDHDDFDLEPVAPTAPRELP